MIKTSGYRVSPTEVEEVLYATRLVGECVAFGVAHRPWARRSWWSRRRRRARQRSTSRALPPNAASACPPTWCRRASRSAAGPLPRNPNGKIDRKSLAAAWSERRAG